MNANKNMNEKMTSYALQTIYQFVMNNTRL